MVNKSILWKVFLICLSFSAVVVLFVLLRHGNIELKDDSHLLIVAIIIWPIILSTIYLLKTSVKNPIFAINRLEEHDRNIHLDQQRYSRLLWGLVLDESDIGEIQNDKSKRIRTFIRSSFTVVLAFVIAVMVARPFEYTISQNYMLKTRDYADGLGGCRKNLCVIFSNLFFSNITSQLLSQFVSGNYESTETFVGRISHAVTPNTVAMPMWPRLNSTQFNRSFIQNELLVENMTGIFGGVIDVNCTEPSYTKLYNIGPSKDTTTHGCTSRSPDTAICIDRFFPDAPECYTNYTCTSNDYGRTARLNTLAYIKNKIYVGCNFTIKKSYMDAEWHYNVSGLTLNNVILSSSNIPDAQARWNTSYRNDLNRLGLTIDNTLTYQVMGLLPQIEKNTNIDELASVLRNLLVGYAQTILMRSSIDGDILNETKSNIQISLQGSIAVYRLKTFVIIAIGTLFIIAVVTGIWRLIQAHGYNLGKYVTHHALSAEENDIK